ncbi:MAG: SDR family NAD(P)-dependent oxidoreductase [Bacteroidetes bacterium]|nr:SDR family NAD(P)-dependent oxidoreductase [Bacteroidota bacterium]
MNKQKFLEQYGTWAIVTGASSGIGVEFAKQLAEMGFNLVLIARRIENMEQLGKELQSKYNIEYKAVELDLTTEGFYATVAKVIDGLDVGLLVNNAGINCEGAFYRGGLDRNVGMIRLNVEAPFILAHEIGKQLIEKGKGGIIFTASTSAFQAMPYFTHYAATKAYVLSLAESMHYEFRKKGVDVIALCPGPTESEMARGLEGNPLVMKAEPVVKSALKSLGRRAHVVPGLGNKIGAAMPQVLGRRLSMEVVGSALKRFLPSARK